MAATLPGLPAELLLKIAKCCGYFRRKVHFEKLRTTSKAINETIVRCYGQTWYKQVCVPVAKASLTRLFTVSLGQPTFHVQSIMTSCNPLLCQRSVNYLSESSEADANPWYGNKRTLGDVYTTKIVLEAVNILRLNIAGADAECKRRLCAPAATDTNKSSQQSSARTHYGPDPAEYVVFGRSEPGAWPRLKQSRILQAAQHVCASIPP
jgi:hypothetical protein